MDSASLSQSLAIALGHWRDWQTVAASRLFGQHGQTGRPDGQITLVAQASLLPAIGAERVSQALGCSSTEWPMTQVLDLPSFLEDQALRRARSGQDQPRAQADRELELVDEMAKSEVLSALLHAPSQAGRMQLASEWVNLFDRWDWLTLAWHDLGSPDAQPIALEGLSWLVDLYAALHQPEHAAHWFWLRRAGRSPPPHLVYWGLPDALAFAQVLVVEGRVPTESLRLPVLQRPEAYRQIWPEIDRILIGAEIQPAAWAPLALRRQQLASRPRGEWPTSARWVKTRTMERGVWAAEQQLRAWLAEGKRRLAVVPSDRRAARRLAAKLTHAGLAVDDPSGWSLDTTLAASALEGLLELASPGPERQPVYNWISHPLVLRGLSEQGLLDSDGLAGLFQSLRAVVRQSRAPGMGRRIDCLPPALRVRLLPLVEAAQQGRRSVAGWIRSLLNVVESIGLQAVWAEDEAGLRLLTLLQSLAAEVDPSSPGLHWPAFRALLARQLSPGRLPIRHAGASIRFMGLAEALLDQAEGVVVMGAAEGQFPARPTSRLVSRDQRSLLEACPEAGAEEALLHLSLAGLFESGTPVFFWAQAPDAGLDELRWSAGLARLRLMLPTSERIDESPEGPEASEQSSVSGVEAMDLSSDPPVLPQLPATLSVSALGHLARCPYRFFWLVVLGMADWESIDEVAGPAESGSLLHRLLQGVAEGPRQADGVRLSSQSSDWLGWLRSRLLELMSEYPLGPGASFELEARLPHLAQWLAETAESHQLVATEEPVQGTLPGSGCLLKGRLDRLDRLDQRGSVGLRLIDIKSTSIGSMRSRLRKDQAGLQLQAYAALLMQQDQAVREMGFLAVGRSSTDWLPADSGPSSTALLRQIDETLLRIQNGEPLAPIEAAGSARACADCSARGACRAATVSTDGDTPGDAFE